MLSKRLEKRLNLLRLRANLYQFATIFLLLTSLTTLFCVTIFYVFHTKILTKIHLLILLMVLLTSIAISLLIAAGLLKVARKLMPYEKSTRAYELTAFLSGAVISTFISIPLSYIFGEFLRNHLSNTFIYRILYLTVTTPLVEEAVKALVLLGFLYLIWDEVISPSEVAIYGALVGLGFTTTENILYILSSTPTGDPVKLLNALLLRWTLTGLLHPLTTGYVGAGIGMWRSRYKGGAVIALSALGIAYIIHLLWNTLSIFVFKFKPDQLIILNTSYPIYLITSLTLYTALSLPLITVLSKISNEERRKLLEALKHISSRLSIPQQLVSAVVDPALRAKLLAAARERSSEVRRLIYLLTSLANHLKTPMSEGQEELVAAITEEVKKLLVLISDSEDNPQHQHEQVGTPRT